MEQVRARVELTNHRTKLGSHRLKQGSSRIELVSPIPFTCLPIPRSLGSRLRMKPISIRLKLLTNRL